MCGICGTFRSSEAQNMLLLQLNENRGRDAVGVLVANEDLTRMRRVRVPLSATEAILNHRIPADIFRSTLFLGHTRAGTSGGNSRENTHPFQCGHLVGAHNGIFGNHHDLREKFKAKHPEVGKFAVDSHVAVWMINKLGPAAAIPQLKGYASMWWVDTRKPHLVSLFVCHNELYLTLDQKAGVPFAFSSDIRHLAFAGLATEKTVKIPSHGIILTIDLTGKDGPFIASRQVVSLNETQEHDIRTSGGTREYRGGTFSRFPAPQSSTPSQTSRAGIYGAGLGHQVDPDDDDNEAVIEAAADDANEAPSEAPSEAPTEVIVPEGDGSAVDLLIGGMVQPMEMPYSVYGKPTALTTSRIHVQGWCCLKCYAYIPNEAIGYVQTPHHKTRKPHCLMCGSELVWGSPENVFNPPETTLTAEEKRGP